jgi:hypothetical protein
LLLLVSSLSALQTARPGPRPAAEFDDSDREKSSLISNDARREVCRRNSRRMVATTSASQAETFG